MVRIRSLDTPPPKLEAPLVVVSSLEKVLDLSAVPAGAVFREAVTDGVDLSNAANEVLYIDIAAGKWSTPVGGFHAWFLREDTDSVAGLLHSRDDLAIDGFLADENWLQFSFTHSEEDDRSAADFAAGLTSAPRLRVEEVKLPPTPPAPTPRARIIAEAARRAKPFKRYLPPRVVHALYKLIGWIR